MLSTNLDTGGEKKNLAELEIKGRCGVGADGLVWRVGKIRAVMTKSPSRYSVFLYAQFKNAALSWSLPKLRLIPSINCCSERERGCSFLSIDSKVETNINEHCCWKYSLRRLITPNSRDKKEIHTPANMHRGVITSRAKSGAVAEFKLPCALSIMYTMVAPSNRHAYIKPDSNLEISFDISFEWH
jgi:hypothetical protein